MNRAHEASPAGFPPSAIPRPAEPVGDVQPPAPKPARRWRRSLWGETWRWLLTGVIFALLAGMTIMVGLVLAVYWQARTDQVRPVDAIVVLGTAQHNGRPGPVLQARLDRALEIYRAGYAPLIVVTGGRAPGDQFTEADAGEMFLLAEGVPVEAIVREDEGRDTWRSMQGVADALAPYDAHTLLLVSDGFHLFRSKLMARDLGFEPYGAVAHDSPIVAGGSGEFTFALREAVAIAAHVLSGR